MMNGYVQKAVIGLLCTMSLVACSSGSSKEDEEDTGYVDVPLGVLQSQSLCRSLVHEPVR